MGAGPAPFDGSREEERRCAESPGSCVLMGPRSSRPMSGRSGGWRQCWGIAARTTSRSSRRERVGLDAVLALLPNVFLLRREDAPANDEWYISIDNRIEYSLSEREAAGWLRVLKQLDGRRTLGEALRIAAVSEGEIRKYLEEALDFGVVALHAVSISGK